MSCQCFIFVHIILALICVRIIKIYGGSGILFLDKLFGFDEVRFPIIVEDRVVGRDFVSSSPRLRRSFTAFRIMTIAMIIQTIRLEPIAMRTTSKTCMMEDTAGSETVVKLRLSKTSWKAFMAS